MMMDVNRRRGWLSGGEMSDEGGFKQETRVTEWSGEGCCKWMQDWLSGGDKVVVTQYDMTGSLVISVSSL